MNSARPARSALAAILVAILLLPPVRAAEPGALAGPPRLDMLRDAFVCPDGEGGYLLTGTAGTFDKSGKTDFDYNRGAPLWRSRDLKTWENPVYAWDRAEHFARGGKPKRGIWLDWSAPADRIDGLLAQATTAPKFYSIQGAWYLLCAMNGQNIIVQKSASGKPEGPYDDHGYLATRGGTPSFFLEDSAVYLVFADGWIARVAPDLEKLAEAPRLLAPAQTGDPAKDRLTLGGKGVALFKREGKYCALAPRWQAHDGKPSHDAVLWTSDKLEGPYRETSTVLRGSGPVTVFQDKDSAWRAVSGLPCGGQPQLLAVP